MHRAQGEAPRWTSLLGGCGIILAMLPWILQSFPNALPHLYLVITGNLVAQLLPPALLAVSFAVLALGVERESGIVRKSMLGIVSLTVFGCYRLVLALGIAATTDFSGLSRTVNDSVTLLGLVAGAIGAVVIARSGVLHGYARWALVPVIVANVLTLALLAIPVPDVAILAVSMDTASLVLFAIAGASYALHGRGPAIRHRMAIINEKW